MLIDSVETYVVDYVVEELYEPPENHGAEPPTIPTSTARMSILICFLAVMGFLGWLGVNQRPIE